MEVCRNSRKGRFELCIRDCGPDEFEVVRIRAVQGHNGNLLSDDTDLRAIRRLERQSEDAAPYPAR